MARSVGVSLGCGVGLSKSKDCMGPSRLAPTLLKWILRVWYAWDVSKSAGMPEYQGAPRRAREHQAVGMLCVYGRVGLYRHNKRNFHKYGMLCMAWYVWYGKYAWYGRYHTGIKA